MAECIALREGLEFSELCGLKVDFVESDDVNVVRAVNSPESLYVIISDIRKCLVDSGGSVCSHVPRKGIMFAHLLASFSFISSSDFVGLDVVPLCIRGAVVADLAS